MAGAGVGDVGAGVGGLIGGAAVLLGAGGSGGEKYFKKAIDLWKDLKDPNFDFSSLSAPELKFIAEYMPQVYEAVVPDEVKLISDSPELRGAQLRGLRRLEQISKEGLPTAERVASQDAMDAVARERRGADAAILRNLAARGNLRSGDAIQARLAAAQGADNLARDLGSETARQAALNRMAAGEAAMNAAGAIRGQDIGVQAANAEAINRSNEAIARMHSEAAKYAADARNRAEAYNVGAKQGIADANTIARYETSRENLDRRNALESDLFNARLRRISGLAGAYNAYGAAQDANKAAREANIMNLGRSVGSSAQGVAGLF